MSENFTSSKISLASFARKQAVEGTEVVDQKQVGRRDSAGETRNHRHRLLIDPACHLPLLTVVVILLPTAIKQDLALYEGPLYKGPLYKGPLY